jgi:hypothetical protein
LNFFVIHMFYITVFFCLMIVLVWNADEGWGL